MAKKKFNINLNRSLGQRIISMIDSNPEAKKLIDRVRRFSAKCDKLDKEGVKKIVETAYMGCILSSLNGGKPEEGLKNYFEGLKKFKKEKPYLFGSEESIIKVYINAFYIPTVKSRLK